MVFTFIHAVPPDASEREVNLNKSIACSHASKVAYARRFGPRVKIINSGKGRSRRSKIRNPEIESSGKTSSRSASYAARTTGNRTDLPTTLYHASNEPATDQYLPRFPATFTYGDTRWQEERSLQFFVANTARDWAGWYDADLWQSLGPQVSTIYDCFRHGLVALGAYHEAKHVKNYDAARSLDLQVFCVSQGQKAVNLFVEQNSFLPASVRLMVYTVILKLSAFFSAPALVQSLIHQHELEHHLKIFGNDASTSLELPQEDREFIMRHLRPIFERQRSKYTQVIDMLWALRNAPSDDFRIEGCINIPKVWSTLFHARKVLEDILKYVTFQIKTGTRSSTMDLLDTDPLMLEWMISLDRFAALRKLSAKQKLTLRILKVTAKVSMIAILTMNERNEMVFDQFTPVYREVADVFKAACSFEHMDDSPRTSINFGLDESLMMLCANTALRFCRCPIIRGDLIKSFYSTDREDGPEFSHTWAQVTDLTRAIEERGIHPLPLSCHDIPQENRRRLTSVIFYMNSQAIQLSYLRYPYRTIDVEEYWIRHGAFLGMLKDPLEHHAKESLPLLMYGQGFFSILKSEGNQEFFTLSHPKFYFNIPHT